MPAMLLVVSLFITTGQEAISATADEKRRFLKLVEELPKGGEFFTDKNNYDMILEVPASTP